MTTLAQQKELIQAYNIPEEGTTLADLCQSICFNHQQVYSVIVPVLNGLFPWGDFEHYKQKYGIARYHETYKLSHDQAEVVLDSIERVVDFKIKRMEKKNVRKN